MSQEIFKSMVLPMRTKLLFLAQKYMEDESDAEDAVQEVLLKLWHTRENLTNYDNTEAFVTTVTKNHCLDRLKVKNRMVALDDSYNIREGTENPHLELERKNTADIIRRIIEKLPVLQQAIIRMKDMEEYEVEEIAEITGTKSDAVRMNLSRARKKVREEYLKLNGV